MRMSRIWERYYIQSTIKTNNQIMTDIKIIKRNLNVDTSLRDSSSPYRVKFDRSTDFKTLRVVCNGGRETQVYETASSNLPSDKDSIYFLADKSGDSFNIRWRGEAAAFMKRVDR